MWRFSGKLLEGVRNFVERVLDWELAQKNTPNDKTNFVGREQRVQGMTLYESPSIDGIITLRQLLQNEPNSSLLGCFEHTVTKGCPVVSSHPLKYFLYIPSSADESIVIFPIRQYIDIALLH